MTVGIVGHSLSQASLLKSNHVDDEEIPLATPNDLSWQSVVSRDSRVYNRKYAANLDESKTFYRLNVCKSGRFNKEQN